MIIIYSILTAANVVVGFMQVLIFAYVILSWIPQARDSKWGKILSLFVEPIFSPVRKLLSRIKSLQNLPIDLSPIVAWLLLSFLQSIIAIVMRYF